MTKREYIQSKWEEAEFAWKEIDQHVNEDGILTGVNVNETEYITGYNQAKKNALIKGIGFDEKNLFMVELDTLQGVDKNNGWVKIENENDLPDLPGEYIVIYLTGKEHRRFYIPSVANEWIEHFTHWRKPFPKPLY